MQKTTQNETRLPADAEVIDAHAIETASVIEPPPFQSRTVGQKTSPLRFITWCWKTFKSTVEWAFGLLSLIVLLSILATVPIAQFLSLGYLLECAARIAREGGRIRDGFVGIRKSARIGGVVLGTWILLQPLRLLIEVRRESELFTGSEETIGGWTTGVLVLGCFTIGQIIWALLRGGRFRSFFWPAPMKLYKRLRQTASGQGNLYVQTRDGLYDFVMQMNLPHFFWLGLRGFFVAAVWLAVPVTVIVLASRTQVEGLSLLISLFGGLLLSIVLLYLPYLQINFATANRLEAGFALRRVRQQFRRAPIAFWAALLLTLSLALPLYILKAELIPREAAWLPSIVFVISILPARLLTGWALSRSRRRNEPRHFMFRWIARLGALPIVFIYALFVFITQFTSWYGAWSLYEQHAFLLPVPFLGV